MKHICVVRAVALLAALCLLAGATALAREREPNGSYAERRAKLRAQVSGPVVIFGYTGEEDASPAYVFNQEHYFYYLTGHNEPGAAVLVVPEPPAGQAYDGPREVLYLPARDLQRERWDGVRLGPDDANIGGRTGFAAVKPAAGLRADLEALAKIYPAFHTLLPARRARGYPHRQYQLDGLKQALPGVEFRDVTSVISAMRQIKSPSEIALIQKSAELSMDAHLEAMRMMRPGLWEYEVASKMEYVHKSGGCEGEAYAPIVGSGFNSTVLHYSMPVNQIQDGDVIVLDVGAQCSGYAADITRTLPASGKFSPRQREVYEIVLGAQNAVLAAIKPGMTMGRGHNGLGQVAMDYINAHGKDRNGEPLGKYFIHGLGHHVGLHVHDPGPPRPLEPGMIVTIEPGIYIPEENLGVRIEDMVLITETGYKLLTARLPRDPDEVESLMSVPQSNAELQASLESAARVLVKVIESGDSMTFPLLVSADGMGFGVEGGEPPIRREHIVKQTEEKRGIYCLVFDTGCLRREDIEAQRQAGLSNLASSEFSFRDLLLRSRSKKLNVYFPDEGNYLWGMSTVVLQESGTDRAERFLDFGFRYTSGLWRLVSAGSN